MKSTPVINCSVIALIDPAYLAGRDARARPALASRFWPKRAGYV
jgi:hypothetical protein